MGGLFGGGGQKSGGTSTVVNSNEPAKYLEPYLTDIAAKGQQAYNQFRSAGYNMPWAGARSVGANSFDDLSTNTALSGVNRFTATGAPQTTYDMADFFKNKVSSGSYLTPANMRFDAGTNPNNTAAIEAQIRPILQNFQEKIIPQMNSAAIQAGAYGGSKWEDLGARTARDTEQVIADTSAKIAYQDFADTRALNQQDNAQIRSLIPQLNAQEAAGANTAISLGNTALGQDLQLSDIYGTIADKERGFDLQALNDQIAYYDELKNSSFAGLGDYAAIINGGAQVGGSTSRQTTTGTKPQSSLGSQLLGAFGGAGGLSALGNVAGAIGNAQWLPWLSTGGNIASIGSSILSAFSDMRLKHNIVPAGTLNGHKVYVFSYLGSAARFLGVMAQDLLSYIPEAVSKLGDYFTVDYSKLGFEMKEV